MSEKSLSNELPSSQLSSNEISPRAQNRTILVTGATGAIGSEIVRALTRHFCDGIDGTNCRIVAHFHQNEAAATKLQRETKCELRRADLCDETEVAALFGDANLSEQNALFAVIHCAAITYDSLLVRQSRARWDDVFRLNCDGAFLVARETLRRLARGGRLIFLTSRVGERGAVGQSAYAASKAATLALMRCAARESAAQRIGVNAICPGVVESEMTANLGAKRRGELAAQSVFGEFGSARAVAATVLWLLGDAASEISGQVFHCDSRL